MIDNIFPQEAGEGLKREASFAIMQEGGYVCRRQGS